MDVIKNFFVELWTTLVYYYGIYSEAVHSVLPNEAGDFAEVLIDAVVVFLIVKFVGSNAFKTGD